jgi:hypothetical protein
MIKTMFKKLSYEDIETLSHNDLKKEKIECQVAIIETKNRIANIDEETDLNGVYFDKLSRKLNHLKKLALKMDIRLAEFNAMRNVSKLDNDNVQEYNNVVRHLEIVQLLKPDSKYAMFHQVCHDFLDQDTCQMLTHETMRRLSILKEEVKEKYPKQKAS